jgi:hypothetical protein
MNSRSLKSLCTSAQPVVLSSSQFFACFIDDLYSIGMQNPLHDAFLPSLIEFFTFGAGGMRLPRNL